MSDERKEDSVSPLESEWYKRKSAFLEEWLGKQHGLIGTSILPYYLGGGLDLYYYPSGIPGTAIASKQLCEVPEEGPSNTIYKRYELVMFTKHALSLEDASDQSTPFGRAHTNMHRILDLIARYSPTAELNPHETCEFPREMDRVGGKCLIFDGYAQSSPETPAEFGLLALIEVFPTEMKFAAKHGGAELIERLKKAGYYPYSDLDRPPVVDAEPGFFAKLFRRPQN